MRRRARLVHKEREQKYEWPSYRLPMHRDQKRRKKTVDPFGAVSQKDVVEQKRSTIKAQFEPKPLYLINREVERLVQAVSDSVIHGLAVDLGRALV